MTTIAAGWTGAGWMLGADRQAIGHEDLLMPTPKLLEIRTEVSWLVAGAAGYHGLSQALQDIVGERVRGKKSWDMYELHRMWLRRLLTEEGGNCGRKWISEDGILDGVMLVAEGIDLWLFGGLTCDLVDPADQPFLCIGSGASLMMGAMEMYWQHIPRIQDSDSDLVVADKVEDHCNAMRACARAPSRWHAETGVEWDVAYTHERGPVVGSTVANVKRWDKVGVLY